ncbi:alanine dehydrogenase [Saccharobesus litoralis]|uniref:Alanine dehydrogenase n=1 Tax=Saccharobesus litoralis TaxID=2172099 RepID=A0A2S0VMK6_9ALTE|nr:alanine dehydrogenase [Saccharobesus litoralis]AWB65448.1 alanine dehydrogenase [Saccharobesus litoralis]
MLVGVPKEIKNHEYRVGLTPASVNEIVQNGHSVIIEENAGIGSGFCNQEYLDVGASIVKSAKQVFSDAELIIKVKEPQPQECQMLNAGQALFTYLHLAPDRQQTQLLLESKATCIAYETVTDKQGSLPLLAPMSEVAGRMSIQAGAYHLQKAQGGLGVLLAGVPGVAPAKVVIIGGGVVGANAAKVAIGMGADVVIIDRALPRLRQLDVEFNGRLKTLYSNSQTIEDVVTQADLVIGAVLVPGAAAPKLVNHQLVKKMKAGSVLVDVAIDQGGCFATSKPTTHQDPTYVVDGVVHYCVANMPGGVARTSTFALNNATLPYVLALVNKGILPALQQDAFFLQGLNVYKGQLTNQAVALAHGMPYVAADLAVHN